MKILSFFLLFFLNFSLFAQKDSLYLLEKQGDSLFLAGQNDQASRVYFRAFLKDILNRRLQDKFGLRNMEQYFSREEYRPFFVKDSTEKAEKYLFKKLSLEADNLLKMKDLAGGLAIYQKLRAYHIGDTLSINKTIQEIRQAQVYFSQIKHQDSLNYFVVQIIDGFTEEIIDTDLKIKALENKHEVNYFKIAKGIYWVSLPVGEYLLTALAKDKYYEAQEKVVTYRIFQEEKVVFIQTYNDMGTCILIDNVNFNTNDYRIEVIEKNKSSCKSAIYALTNFDRLALKFEGHCDSTEQQPTFLSLKRTVEVVKYLVNRGIVPHRLVFEYFGSDSPMVPNDSSNNRALNRRVVLYPIWREYKK